jgi:hypothetical protein
MVWSDLVILLALVQFMFFSYLVGRARGLYGIVAPATSGHEMFERYYRVQMNTIEMMVMFVPAMYLCANYWSPIASAVLGVIYLVGRFIYLVSYVKEPSTRSLGYGMSAFPIVVLVVGALVGMVRSVAHF